MDIHDYARKIYDQSRLHKVAVFKIEGEIRYMPARGAKFDVMFRDFQKQLCGIYDSACTMEMIKEDIDL